MMNASHKAETENLYSSVDELLAWQYFFLFFFHSKLQHNLELWPLKKMCEKTIVAKDTRHLHVAMNNHRINSSDNKTKKCQWI